MTYHTRLLYRRAVTGGRRGSSAVWADNCREVLPPLPACTRTTCTLRYDHWYVCNISSRGQAGVAIDLQRYPDYIFMETSFYKTISSIQSLKYIIEFFDEIEASCITIALNYLLTVEFILNEVSSFCILSFEVAHLFELHFF